MKKRSCVTTGIHVLVFSVLALAVTFTWTPAAGADAFVVPETAQSALDGTQTLVDGFLNGVESGFAKTGFVDLKEHMWNEYQLLIKPYVKMGLDLTSNVFKTQGGAAKGDDLWTVTPGVQLTKKLDYGVVGGTYEASWTVHGGRSKQNRNAQSFLVYANLQPTEEFYIRSSERYSADATVAGAQNLKPVNVNDNTVNVVMGLIRDNDWIHEVGYENFNRDFRNQVNTGMSYNENKVDYRLYKIVQDGQGRLFSGYRVGFVHFLNLQTRETTYHEFPIGYDGELPWYGIMAHAYAGIQHRNLGDGNRQDHWFVFVADIDLRKKFNEDKTEVVLAFNRRPVEGAFSTATIYDEKMWSAEVQHLITQKLRGRLKAFIGNRDFKERTAIGGTFNDRLDLYRGVNVGFDVSVRRWLIFHLDYFFTRRDSNFPAMDYTDHTMSIRSTIPI